MYMDRETEKSFIYNLMKEIIRERRELSKHYYDLKERLDKLEFNDENSKNTNEEKKKRTISRLAKEKMIQDDYYHKKHKTDHLVPFDKISKNIIYLLKQSDIPVSNKKLYERLKDEFELNITYSNLVSNVLPRTHKDTSIPVERAYRGFWQYRK